MMIQELRKTLAAFAKESDGVFARCFVRFNRCRYACILTQTDDATNSLEVQTEGQGKINIFYL